MKIKIPKKRADEILEEELQRFLAENKNIDRKQLEEFLKRGERK